MLVLCTSGTSPFLLMGVSFMIVLPLPDAVKNHFGEYDLSQVIVRGIVYTGRVTHILCSTRIPMMHWHCGKVPQCPSTGGSEGN